MTRSQFAELRVQQITQSMGATAPRTSRDVCRDAVAIEHYKRRPFVGRVFYAVCALGAVAAIAFNNYS
jgi:hypothetical protein